MKQSGLKSQAHVKDPRYTQLICKRFCSFYKPGKNRLACGTYEFIRRNLTPVELEAVVEDISGDASLRKNDLTAVCKRCAFHEAGCDFFAKGKALSTSKKGALPPPCGGYLILSRSLSTRNRL